MPNKHKALSITSFLSWTYSKVKAIKMISLTALVFLALSASMSWASPEELKNTFDNLVLNSDHQDKIEIKKLLKGKKNQIQVELGAGMEAVEVSVDFENKGLFDFVWGLGTFELDPNAHPQFDIATGTFKSTYSYVNSLKRRIPMTFVFTSVAIRRLGDVGGAVLIPDSSAEVLPKVSPQTEIENSLDNLVLNTDGNDLIELQKLLKMKKNQIRVVLLDSLEVVNVAVAWDNSGLLNVVWGWGRFEKDPNALAHFDLAHGTFQSTYIYVNTFKKKTAITFTFTSAAIARLNDGMGAGQIQLEPGLVEPKVLVGPSSSSSRVTTSTLVVPKPSSSCSSSDDFQSLSDSDDDAEYFDCETSVRSRVASTLNKLDKVLSMSETLVKTVGEYDHIWTLAFTGTDGAKNVIEGWMTANPLTALYGAAQLAVAAKSGFRAYKEISGRCSSEAEALLNDIGESARQIEDFSATMGSLLNNIHDSFSGLEGTLKDTIQKQTEITRLFNEASVEEQLALRDVLTSYDEARIAGGVAAHAFGEFRSLDSQIRGGWEAINAMFGELTRVLSQPLKVGSDSKKQFEDWMVEVSYRIVLIHQKLESLSEPMDQQDQLSRVVSQYRDLQDRHLAEAASKVLNIAAKAGEANKALVAQMNLASLELQGARQTVIGNLEKIRIVENKLEEVTQLAIAVQTDVVRCKKEISCMYTTQDILIGAGIACICGPIGGTAAALIVGLASLKASQAFGH